MLKAMTKIYTIMTFDETMINLTNLLVTFQMFIDYNIYGMNMINVGAVKFRKAQNGELRL